MSEDAPLLAALREQAEAWRRGAPLTTEELLGRHPALASDDEAVLDLVCNEVAFRRARGDGPTFLDYAGRFPHLRAQVAVLFELDDLFASGDTPLLPAAPDGLTEAERQQFSDRGYEVLSELGRGGMGVVYRARQVRLGRIVAIKTVFAEHAGSPAVRARFRNEARAVARLQHPNVVQIHEQGELGERPYFSLEYCDGGSLRDRLGECPLPPREAAGLLRILAETLHHAHLRGVVHGDLTPANILLVGDAETPLDRCVAKVNDFGLARFLGDPAAGTEPAVRGTPSYMAPEQVEGRPGAVGVPADIHALGAIGYQFVTGRPPYRGESVAETLFLVQHDHPPRPADARPGTPIDLEAILLMCLRKDPARRYRTAADLAQDLTRFLAGEPVQARPTSPGERVGKWARRNPSVAALLAVGVLLPCAVAALSVWFSLQLREEASRARRAEAVAKADRLTAERATVVAGLQAHLARDTLHAIQVGQAFEQWSNATAPSHLERAVAILDEAGPGFRDEWESRHVRELCARRLRSWQTRGVMGGVGQTAVTLRDPGASVLTVRYSPDGRHLLSAGKEKSLTLWDAEAGRVVRTAGQLPGQVWDASFSPDGGRVALACGDRNLWLWDVHTGALGDPRAGHSRPVRSVAYSPCGRWIATGAGDLGFGAPVPGGASAELMLWDARTGAGVGMLEGLSGSVRALAFSPDGGLLAVSSGNWRDRTDPGQLTLWDVAGRRQLGACSGHPAGLMCVAFSPDGGLVAGGGADRVVWEWDVTWRELVRQYKGSAGPVASLAYAPDGRRLVAAAHQTLQVWSTETAVRKLTLRWHTAQVSGVAFHPDGRTIASSGFNPEVRLWQADSSALDWHGSQANACEAAGRWPAAAFHLERLCRLDPRARPRLLAALRQAGDSPLTLATRANLGATDFARAAAVVAQPPGPFGAPFPVLR